MKHYTGNLVDLHADGPPWLRELAEKLRDVASTGERIRTVEAEFRRRLSKDEQPLLAHCFENLKNAPGGSLRNTLEASTDLSYRRLEQLFAEKIGLSPKRIHRIQRMRKSLEYMRHFPEKSFTEVAHHFHYFDQPHFIREFRHFTGYAPRQLRDHLNPDPDVLNLIVS